MAIPSNISKDHVLKAIYKINQIGISSLRTSTKFELFYKEKRYPPKEVIRFANEVANGYELVHFGGGDESNNFLIKLGFTVVLKDTDEIIGLDYTKKKKQGIKVITGAINQKEIPKINQEDVEKDILTNTEKEHLAKVRIGHSDFKRKLIDKECKCKICGVTDKSFLIASHIKPWYQSSNEERLDLDNGFLFCPNHDALFDKGFITFDDNGKIVISNLLNEETRIFLNVTNTMKIEVNEGNRYYLEWHRLHVFKNE
ncbi:HNH endonuclease [Psychrobacillus sp. Sa2BUA9]|uniref:HNH endonuclease n=1 Tax=Psychrobacillus faecigallinarum TaxID=2762235 RepID=A0ABR8RDE7_9BACI|nr:HNH endonuclease signature motif containing protein [Psychrobacillus faecigallinarum]MBD7945687.1 HNH endonuclease [Psychrobacillus faecigallinarum]